jgi:hypothetical protein
MYRLLFLVGFVAVSCAPAYISNSRNVPMFAEGGEFAASVAVSSGVDVQTAYSLTDHIAIMANANAVIKKLTPPGKESFNRDHLFGEAGLGYFTRTKTMRVELYGGYGMGQGNSYESFFFFGKSELVAKGKYSRIFIQPSIATNKKKFNLAFTVRLSMVDFSEFSTTDPAAVTPLYIPTDGMHGFLEPSLTARVHLAGNLRGFFQLGLNQPLNNDVYFNYVPLQAAIGIQIHTGQLRTRVY